MYKYEYQGKTFEIDDSKGCYLVVTYKDLVGYVGVNLQGTATQPYGWTIGNENITPDGLQGIYDSGLLPGDNLDALCAYLIAQQEEADARARFKPEDACVALHEFVKGL